MSGMGLLDVLPKDLLEKQAVTYISVPELFQRTPEIQGSGKTHVDYFSIFGGGGVDLAEEL